MPLRLPLFPLKVVLFPGALLPLHIFEPRYRRLLADVAADDHRFGILPAGDDGGLPAPGAVGCVARVRGVQSLPDGRSNIVVGGENRFRYLGPAAADSPYGQGLVEPLDDLPDVQVPSQADTDRLHGLTVRYAAALESLNDQSLDRTFSADAAPLSFEAAALLEWEFDDLQRMLECRSVSERVVRLLHALPSLVQAAEQHALIHGRAKQNGHGALR
jgi:Lon protease-like protein